MGSRKTLKEELAMHKGKTVLLGTRSSFFFIGPCEEALRDMELLGPMARCCAAISANRDALKALARHEYDDIGERKVLKVYPRSLDCDDDETVVIIQGPEFGAFWTRAEYLAGKRALLAALSKIKPATDGLAEV